MELALPGEPEAEAGVKGELRNPLDQLDPSETDTPRGIELLMEDLARFARWYEQIAIEPGKSAVDGLLPNDVLNAIDGRGMTGRSQPGPVPAMQPLQFEIAVVQRVREMRGGAASLASPDRSIVQHDDALARFREQVCR